MRHQHLGISRRLVCWLFVTSAGLGCPPAPDPVDNDNDNDNDVVDDEDDGSAVLRVVHLGPDAPAIDVYVGQERPVVEDLDFLEGSDEAEVRAATEDVHITVAGADVADAVVTLNDVEFEAGRKYTSFAFGLLGTPISAGVVEDNSAGLASTNVRLRVIHAADGIGTVDVLAGSDVVVDGLRFGTASDTFDVQAAAFAAGLDVNDDGAADLRFEVPALPAGSVVNVFAVKDGEDVFLLAQLDGDATVRLDPSRQRLRVVHLSPDAPAVEPLVNGVDVGLGRLRFPASSDDVPLAGATATVNITTDGTVATSVLDVAVDFDAGEAATVVVLDRLAGLEALVLEDSAAGLAPGDLRVRAIHGAPDVGQVDVLAIDDEGGATALVSNLDFGDASNTLDLPAGRYTVGLDLNNDLRPELQFELPELPAGTLANLYATQTDDGDVFLLAQLDGDVTARIDPATSRARVLHLSRNAPDVDVYVDGNRVVDGLAFKDQSASLEVSAGFHDVAVTAAGASINTAVIEAEINLLAGQEFVVVAYGDLATIGALVVKDDRAALANANIRIPVTHCAPTVTRGDVFELRNGGTTFGVQLVDDFGFGETEQGPDLPAGQYRVGFDAEADGDVDASFALPLLAPGTFARAYVYQEANGAVGILLQLANTTQEVLADTP